jgi:hypothetical protein
MDRARSSPQVRASIRSAAPDIVTHSEYQELTAFFVEQLVKLRDETRTIIEVTVESLRDEIRVVADGVLTNGRRIEENGRRIDEVTRRLDALSDRVGHVETILSSS